MNEKYMGERGDPTKRSQSDISHGNEKINRDPYTFFKMYASSFIH